MLSRIQRLVAAQKSSSTNSAPLLESRRAATDSPVAARTFLPLRRSGATNSVPTDPVAPIMRTSSVSFSSPVEFAPLILNQSETSHIRRDVLTTEQSDICPEVHT